MIMGILDPILEPVGKAMVFESIRPGLRSYMAKAGFQEVPYVLFGQIFYALLGVFLAIYIPFISPKIQSDSFILFFTYHFFSVAGILALLAFFAIIFIHFYTNMRIYHRTKELEHILPDYLMLVSTNLKGGMAFEKALWDAIKPEFGVLANEIGLVSKKVMTGNEVVSALNEFVLKYESPILRRNFQLIIGEFESGGEITNVIDRIIQNLKKTQLLKKEMIASTVTYMLFISALVVAISPVLFALSYQLFFLIQGFMAVVATSASPAQGALQIAAPDIKAIDFQIFSVLAIVIIASGSAFITSIIEKGDFSAVIKYAPIYIISALIVYTISLFVLGNIFAGMNLS